MHPGSAMEVCNGGMQWMSATKGLHWESAVQVCSARSIRKAGKYNGRAINVDGFLKEEMI